MDFIKKSDLPEVVQRARTNWRAIGGNAKVEDSASCGFCHFSLENGTMIAHKHEREIMYVVDAKGTTVRFGPESDKMTGSVRAEAGMIMRAADGEWHVFEMDDKDSYMDIIWFFDVPQNHATEAE